MDNSSKFGTLSLVRQPQLINTKCNNLYQIGKSLIKFLIEEQPDTNKKPNSLLKWLCCVKEKSPEEIEREKRYEELVLCAPVKDELVTHDGILYFPRELMPPEKDEDIQKSARLGFKGN